MYLQGFPARRFGGCQVALITQSQTEIVERARSGDVIRSHLRQLDLQCLAQHCLRRGGISHHTQEFPVVVQPHRDVKMPISECPALHGHRRR